MTNKSNKKENPGRDLEKLLFKDLGVARKELLDNKIVDPGQLTNVLNNKLRGVKPCKFGRTKMQDLLKFLAERSAKPIDEIWENILKIYQNSEPPFSEAYPPLQISQINEYVSNFSGKVLNNHKEEIKHNLPELSIGKFIGRTEEIEKLLDEYINNIDSNIPIIVDGIGGVGKTALVVEVAKTLLNLNNNPKYPRLDAIVFTTAKTDQLYDDEIITDDFISPDNTLEKILNKIADTLNSEEIKQSNILSDKCESAIKILKDNKTLLIIDNLETIEDKKVRRFINRLPKNVTTIITTREITIHTYVDISLDNLSEDEALELIREEIKHKNISKLNIDEQKQLYKETSGIPLAIKYAIGLIADGYYLEDLINKLKSRDNTLVRFLFETSVGKLRNSGDEVEKIAYKLLMAMSILQEPLLKNVVREIAGLKIGSDVSRGFVTLVRRCLIRNSESIEDQYTMLSLTREYAYAELVKKENEDLKHEFTENWIKYYIKLAQGCGKDYGGRQKGYWYKLFDKLENQFSNLLSVSEYCAIHGYYEDFKELWRALHSFTEVYGHWGEHYAHLKRLADQAERNLDPATSVFAKSAMARVKIRACSNDELDIAEKLLQEAWEQSKKIRNLSLSVRVELLENYIMFHIELNQLEKAQHYLNKLFTLVDQTASFHNDLTDDDKIRYKIIAKYRQGQIWHKKAFKDQNIRIQLMDKAEQIFREAIQYADEIAWMRSKIALQTRLAELLIEQNTNNLNEAAELLESALSATTANRYLRRSAYCLFAWARLYDKQNQKEKANGKAKEALDIFKHFRMEKRQKVVNDFLEKAQSN